MVKLECKDELNEIMEFPEIFENPSLIKDKIDAELVASACCAWGICMSGMGVKVPDKFGVAMVAIRQRTGMKQPPTPEGFMEFSKQFLK